jgi:hypothetical protein
VWGWDACVGSVAVETRDTGAGVDDVRFGNGYGRKSSRTIDMAISKLSKSACLWLMQAMAGSQSHKERRETIS